MKNDKELALSLIEELFDLKDKIKKLDSFTKSSSFPALPDNEQSSVSDLIKDVIYMTPAEKAEFDGLKNNYVTLEGALHGGIWNGALHNRIFRNNQDYQERNKAQLEFARAWANPSLIAIKGEPKFAYKLKDWVQPILKSTGDEDYIYLGLDGDLSNLHAVPQYQTAKKWQSVNNHIKEILDKVAEE